VAASKGAAAGLAADLVACAARDPVPGPCGGRSGLRRGSPVDPLVEAPRDLLDLVLRDLAGLAVEGGPVGERAVGESDLEPVEGGPLRVVTGLLDALGGREAVRAVRGSSSPSTRSGPRSRGGSLRGRFCPRPVQDVRPKAASRRERDRKGLLNPLDDFSDLDAVDRDGVATWRIRLQHLGGLVCRLFRLECEH
jgi:hypothetical protein